MAYFSELDNIMNLVIGKILGNQRICKVLHFYPDSYSSEEDSFNYNPLDEDDIPNTRILLLDKIFPMPKDPKAVTEQKGLLTVTLTGGDVMLRNQGYRNVNLVFDIVFHLNSWIVRGGYRPFIIAEELDKMFNYQLTDLPIFNKPEYIGFKCKDYSNYFYGLQIIYQLTLNSNIDCSNSPKNLNIRDR